MHSDIQGDPRILHHDWDTGIAVLAKPYGVTTIDFVESVRPFFQEAASKVTDPKRDFFDDTHPAHQLDQDTSGCLVVGFNSYARRRVQGAFTNHRVTKQYMAIVSGVPSEVAGDIDAPLLTEDLQEDGRFFSRTRIDPNGKPAQTRYEMLATDGEESLVCLTPLTGRTHQLRVHCAERLETPILGDKKYNPKTTDFSMPMCLHAWFFSVPQHDREALTVTAPMPSYMVERVANMKSLNTGGLDALQKFGFC